MSDAFIAGLGRARAFLAAIPDAAEKATAAALNKAATAARDTAVSAVTARYAVRAGDVREKLTVKPARASDLTATLTARSGSLSLTYFPHTPQVPGTGGRGKSLLRVEVLRGQQREVEGAFVATIGGKPRIMVRSGGRTAKGNAPIRALSSVPIGKMLGAESVREAVEKRALEKFDEVIDREIDRALGKAA